VTYTAVIRALGQAGEWAECLRVFEAMRSKGLSPDAVSYNSLLHACAQAGKVGSSSSIIIIMIMIMIIIIIIITTTTILILIVSFDRWTWRHHSSSPCTRQGCGPMSPATSASSL
jgi:pentatricopeptide repeat protein